MSGRPRDDGVRERRAAREGTANRPPARRAARWGTQVLGFWATAFAATAHASGCALDRTGLGATDATLPDLDGVDLGAIDLGTVDDAGNGGGDDGGPIDLGVADSGSDLGMDAGPTCDPEACPGLRCVEGGCGHYTTCRALHEADSDLESGVYEIDPDGAGALSPVRVWCDMDIDGGGWTLVGRTAGNMDGGDFGWIRARGDVEDDDSPYSFGLASELSFTQILVGRRGSGKTWGGNVYRIDVGTRFVASYPRTGATFPITVVQGSCRPTGGPRMLLYWGHTSATTLFFFRDSQTLDVFGMRPHEFNVNYSDCTNGGDLNGAEGMIMVR